MQSLVLVDDGIRGWAMAGAEYTEWMGEDDEAAWSKS